MTNKHMQVIEKRSTTMIYVNEVLIPHLHSTITNAELKFSVLIDSFHTQFYNELSLKLEKKKELFEFYLTDLLEIKSEFDEMIMFEEKLELNEDEKEFESILTGAISELNILIKRFDLEIGEIERKKEIK